jgi:hypothetical protein
MNAAEFVRRLCDGGRLIGIEVTEPVDLANAAGPGFKRELGAIDLQEVHFHGDVSFANCNFDGGITFRNCIFDGSLNLGKTAVRDGILLTECRFDIAGARPNPLAIILDDARIRGDLVCDRVTTNGCISMRRLRLAGNVEFTECTVAGEALPERAALDLSDAKIKGSVIFETGRWPSSVADPGRRPWPSSFRDGRTSDPASVLLRGANVTDMVKLSWAQFQGEVDLAFITCRSLESEVGIFSRPAQKTMANAGQKSIKPAENVGGASIAGRITLSGGNFGLIHLHGISISGEMMLIAGQSGQIIIEEGICPAEYNEHFIVPSKLGHFIMSSWRCSGFLHLHAAEVIGESNPSRIRGVVIRSSVIDHSLSLWPGARLQRSLERYLEAGCTEKERPKFFVINRRGFFLPVECRGDYRNLLNRWRRRMVVQGNVSIDHCSIGDDLLLTGIDLIANSETDDGRIEVVDSRIDGNLVFRSPISFLADAQVDAPLLRLFAQRLAITDPTDLPEAQRLAVTDPTDLPKDHIQIVAEKDYRSWRENFVFVPACCHMLDTTGLKAIKIDLTGLCVRKPLKRDVAAGASAQTAGKREENLPNAVMSNSEVSGKIATFARLSGKATEEIYKKIKGHLEDEAGAAQQPTKLNWPGELLAICFGPRATAIELPTSNNIAHAEISGSLDLQHSALGELLISDASFRQHSPLEKAAECGVVLDYAQISKLYVARSQLPHVRARGHNGFPVPVSLLDFSVKTWFLEDEEATEVFRKVAYLDREATTVNPYLDLLENDPEFRMSSYLAVEKSLRDRGLTDEARQIFIAANYRDVRTEAEDVRSSEVDLPASPQKEDRFSWKIWRRGDGRLRHSMLGQVSHARNGKRDVLAVGLCAIGVVWLGLTIAGVFLDPSPRSFAWWLPLALYFFALNGNIFRLRRPLREYASFLLSALWCAGFFYASVEMVIAPSWYEFAFFVLLLVCFFVLLGAIRCFVDQLYWSLVDYGTSAVRLAGVIFILMVISFALVSRNRQNFEPTLLALSVPQQQQQQQQQQPTVKWDNKRRPTSESWVFGERLWMTLRYHVPLVGAVISDEWQPADRGLTVVGLSPTGDDNLPPDWWPRGPAWERRWPRARDWYGAMLWLNWILWPLFLPFLIHRLSRER